MKTAELEKYDTAGTSPESGRIVHIPIDLIQPGRAQMRRHFDDEALEDLALSIRSAGLIQPVVVRSVAERYELLAGERRWRAAQKAGYHEIPALVRDDIDDREAVVLGLIENLQRESLTPMETAHGLKALSEQLTLTHEAAAGRIGKSRVYVTNFLRLLNLTPRVQEIVNDKRMSMGHARAIAGLDATEQEHWAVQTLRSNWSVRTLEQKLRQRGVAKRPRCASGSDWERLSDRLTELLGNKVVLRGDDKGRGEMNISFHSYDELDGLLDRLGYREEW